MSNKTVWVLSSGENGEGGNNLTVFARKPSKGKVLQVAPKPLLGRDWELEQDDKEAIRWEAGCDFLLLERLEVRS